MKEADKLLDDIRRIDADVAELNQFSSKSKDYHLNRCLDVLDKMQILADNQCTYLKDWYIKQGFDIYLKLQDKNALETSESRTREIPMSSLNKEQLKQVKNSSIAQMNWNAIGHAKPYKHDSLRPWYRPPKKGHNKKQSLENSDYWVFRDARKKS